MVLVKHKFGNAISLNFLCKGTAVFPLFHDFPQKNLCPAFPYSNEYGGADLPRPPSWLNLPVPVPFVQQF